MKNPIKPRLDELIVAKGLAPTRAKAQALILAGRVLVNGEPKPKAGDRVASGAEIEITPGSTLKYVSRGGLKLEGALQALGVSVSGKIALDVGSSTGGFTDCLLQSGAQLVYAVDVGQNLMHERLRADPRVRLIEKMNARYLSPELFDHKPRLAVIDVSFISVNMVLPPAAACLEPPFEIIALVKPQFEVGRGKTKGGVVKDEALRSKAIESVRRFIEAEMGLTVAGECPSPVPGPEGNVEHFLYIKDA
ncbi:MAG: TlyA family RNA methyltransferase [Elusimicrobia bacterium]|nr:TlyA family RNA methyltransferase [Elusimicrobiota bacterium]